MDNLSGLRNFQLFAISEKGNISNQKLRNCWVAKTLMSSKILCKLSSFSKKIYPKLFAISVQIFRDSWNTLSIFKDFLQKASSENDKHMLMKQKYNSAQLLPSRVTKGGKPCLHSALTHIQNIDMKKMSNKFVRGNNHIFGWFCRHAIALILETKCP